MLLAIVALTAYTTVAAQTIKEEDLVKVSVNRKIMTFPNDAPAYIDKKGRTQIPARFIGEALGADVEWNAAEQKATFTKEFVKGITIVEFYIGSADYYVTSGSEDTETLTMDTAAVIMNNRTYVPVRFLAEALGAEVRWDQWNRVAYINLLPDFEEPEKYDADGLMLAQYANVYFDEWNKSLRLTYESGRVWLSYTIPDDLPKNTELLIILRCYLVSGKLGSGIRPWQYYSLETAKGDREVGYEYLIPSYPNGGEVKKELSYIALKDMELIIITCGLSSPIGDTVFGGVGEKYSQSAYQVTITPQQLNQSYLDKYASNARHTDIDEYCSREKIDGASIVIIK